MKRKIIKILMPLFLLLISLGLSAQITTGVSGKVSDNMGELLLGATVVDVESGEGIITDLDGKFVIELTTGEKELIVSFLGYDKKSVNVTIEEGKITKVGVIRLQGSVIGIGSIDIMADRAKERETPVAFSNLSKTQIEDQLGSRDVPLVMNVTPSVYATQQGGGSGDARINVRGFNQRNVAIMINGVPVNDMENGWVYWSNWDGIADATSSIQMQRGLSAVNLATPSIGGTMNIITNPAISKSGVIGKFEVGSGGFLKTTISGSSGLINNKFATNFSLVRKVGNGVIDKTWTDAWAYYFGASYIINDDHRVEFYALGAPQRHGQNSYKQHVAAYSEDYAREIGVVDEAIDKFSESEAGRMYNENWGEVDASYNGEQQFNGKTKSRYTKNFINERENFYHKPITNLNLYSKWSDKITQFTTLYYSGGNGGGTGTLGSLKWDYSGPSRFVDFNATIANNSASDTAFGILRNSNNDQWTVGVLSKAKITFTDNLKGSVGIDWRTAKIRHFRDVRDLLGGKFFVDDNNQFESGNEYNKVLGDIIDYNFTNTVNWFGYFAQLEYSNDKITAYGTFGNSYTSYTYTNHFVKGDDGNELYSETQTLPGYQLKGGLSYRILDVLSFFGNYGYVSKAPIFDNIVSDRDGTVADDVKNEKFNSFEFGANYMTLDRKLAVNANYYNTLWTDRALNINIINQDGSEGFIFVNGMDQLHKGFELDANYKFGSLLTIGLATSFSNWEYINDVSGEYKDYDNSVETTEYYDFYVKGLKVGDAPQQQIMGTIALQPIKGLKVQLDARRYSNYYADWDPFSRIDIADIGQVWEVPDYTLLDLHLSYAMRLNGKYNVTVFAHVFNMLDEVYVQDATDNSRYNGFYGDNNQYSHTANSAEVFLGLPRTFNAGVKVSF